MATFRIEDAGFHNVDIEAPILKDFEYEHPEGCVNFSILVSKKDYLRMNRELCGMGRYHKGGCTCGSTLDWKEETPEGIWFNTHPDNIISK